MDHFEQLFPKFSVPCYDIRWTVHISNINTLESVYYAHFHSILKYGFIFWGNSSNSGKIFTLQTKIIKIMDGAQPRPSCISLFKQLGTLPVPSQYMFSLMSFIISNQDIFETYSSIYNINKRNSGKIFTLQKKVINIMAGAQPRPSYMSV